MKKLFWLSACLMVLVGCAEQEAAAPAEIAATPEATEPEAQANGPDAYYEYLWCKQGPEYSQEAIASLVTDWNAIMDASENSVTAAFGYRPKGWETEDYDGLWVLRWNNKAEMEAGWASYVSTGAGEAFDAKYDPVLLCGDEVGVNRFGFDAYIPRGMPETFTGEPSPYYLTNSFCSFNEGMGPENLREVVGGTYIPAVDAAVEQNPGSSYWFMVGAPDFEVAADNAFDFNFVNYWQTAEEGQASSAGFAESEQGQATMAAMNAVATCQEPQPWDGYVIRQGNAS
jgi:hypothetical protein